MTIHNLYPHSTSSKRPTVSTPIIQSAAIAASLRSLDDHARLLRCAADSAALVETNDGEMVEALYFLHTQLRTEIDRLFSLL